VAAQVRGGAECDIADGQTAGQLLVSLAQVQMLGAGFWTD
jgi:hypothetical protein